MPTLLINGQEQELDVPDDMPLLWVLRDVVGLTGTKFGCGIALCGACTVHVDGRPIRSCITPVASMVGKKITTIEAIGETASGAKIQRAWLSLEVVQCGYCQTGQIMSAAALIESNPNPGGVIPSTMESLGAYLFTGVFRCLASASPRPFIFVSNGPATKGCKRGMQLGQSGSPPRRQDWRL